jgi:hypothetical protein
MTPNVQLPYASFYSFFLPGYIMLDNMKIK